MFYTIKGGEKSSLVPALGQMFEINGNFLIFFEGDEKVLKKKEKKMSVFIG